MVNLAVHFVGFRTDAEYSAAVRVFGKPDFIHRTHDSRVYRGIADGDIVLFGLKAKADVIERRSGDDIREQSP